MLLLKEVTQVLVRLCDEPSDTDSVQQNEIWSRVSTMTEDSDCTYNPADIESFSDVIRRLSNKDLDDDTTHIAAYLEKGLLAVLTFVFESSSRICDRQQNTGLLLNVMDLVCVASETGSKAKSMLAATFGGKFLEEMTASENRCYSIEVGKCVNLLLETCPTRVRELLINDAKVAEKLHQAASMIYTAGDYELQVGIIECLFRFIHKKMRKTYIARFFQDTAICESFLQITDGDFETDSRIFLNHLNSSIKSKQRVISVACDAAKMGANELKKPDDPKYPQFWVDFNGGVGRLSLFCEQEGSDSQGEESTWETVSFWRRDIKSYKLDVESKPTVLTFQLRRPLEETFPSQCSGQKETSAVFTFDPGLNQTIQEALVMTYGSSLDWRNVKDQGCKASRAITPVRLKLHNKSHLGSREEILNEVLSEGNETDDVNRQSRFQPKTGTPTKPSSSTTPVHQKISVPALPMSTPAGISFPKVQKPVTSTVGMMAADSTGVKQPTPNKNTDVKDFQMPKTPIGKRTRSVGKVKTPLTLEPSSSKSFRRERKKQLQQGGSLEAVDSGKLAADKSIGTASKETVSSHTENVELDTLDLDIKTIPDSLPLMKDVAVTAIILDRDHSCTKYVDKPRKSLGDSGIDVHDQSTFEQGKDVSFADEEGELSEQPSEDETQKKDNLKITSTIVVEDSWKPVQDEHPGEIPNDFAESSLPTPRRSNRLATFVNPSSDLISQSSPSSQACKGVKPKPSKTRAKKGQQSEKKQTTKASTETKRSMKIKEKGKTERQRATSSPDHDDELPNTQTSVNSLEEFSVIFAKPKMVRPAASQKLLFNRTEKKTVYSSTESFYQSSSLDSKKDPYDFDADAETNSSSRYKCKGAKKPNNTETNKIFTSRNKSSGSNATVCNDKSCKSKKGLGHKERVMQDTEINCFGFDTFEQMDLPVPGNVRESDHPSKVTPQTVRSPLDIQSKDISSTLEGRENTATPNSGPALSGKCSKMLTLRRIEEKVKQAGCQRISKTERMSESNNVATGGTSERKTSPHQEQNADDDDEQNLFGANEDVSIDPVLSPELTPGPPKQVNGRAKAKKIKPAITTMKNREPEKNIETEFSDENIVTQFSDICKGIVANSVAKDQQRGRRCKKHVTYKELSESDVEEDHEDNQNDSDDEITLQGGDDIQSSFDRSEISWLGSQHCQRKRIKQPVKTYRRKVFDIGEQSTPLVRDDLELEIDRIREDLNPAPEMSDMGKNSRKTKCCVSGKRQAQNRKQAKRTKGNPHVAGGEKEKFLTVCLTPLKLDKDVAIIGDDDRNEKDDLSFDQLTPITPDLKNLLGYNIEDEDEDFDLKLATHVRRQLNQHIQTPSSRLDREGDLITPAPSPKLVPLLNRRFSNNVENNLSGYHIEDQDQNFDLELATDVCRKSGQHVKTPMMSYPSIVTPASSRHDQNNLSGYKIEDQDQDFDLKLATDVCRKLGQHVKTPLMPYENIITSRLDQIEQNEDRRRPFVSGPSSTRRAPKSASKRKYEIIAEESEDEKSNMIVSPDIPASQPLESDSPLKPRKLFRSNAGERAEQFGVKGVIRGAYQAPSSSHGSRSLSSEESLSQLETLGDMGLETGVTAFINTFGVDLQNRMKEKQTRLDSLTRGVAKTTHKHVTGIWMEQSETRVQLMDDLRENVLLELIELEKDIARLNESEDQAMEFFKKQLIVLQNCRKSQELRLRNLRRLQAAYDRKTEDMSTSEKQQQASLKEVLKREMATLHKRLSQDTQQQEMGKFRRSLNNLF